VEILQGYSYHIKDEFFELVQDDRLMSNKEYGKYRPHYYAIVYCKIKVPKVAEQKWTLLQVHFGHNCKALYHDSMERCCA
jgi:hypothetical protein